MKNLLPTFLACLLLTACQMGSVPTTDSASKSASHENAAPRLTLILINDTYRLDYLPQVRTLRQQLEHGGAEVLMLHAGDFLFPSLLSQQFNGAQMIDLFNRLDGDAGADDPAMFVTFGNHEFEKTKLADAALVQARIEESQFHWLGSNIRFRQDARGKPLVAGPNLVDSQLITRNGIKVGLLSATIDVKHPDYVERFDPPIDSIRRLSAQLRAQGAQVVVALTHLSLAQDKAILANLGADGPDLIAGGHEHDRKLERVNGRLVVKADADALSAAVIRLTPGAPAQATVEFVDLPKQVRPDPALQARTVYWNEAFDRLHCAKHGKAPGCMANVYGKTRVNLVGEELRIRRFETNLGNFLADTARDAFAAQGAQIAFLNSGSMRLNHDVPPGDITRQQVDSLFAYPMPLSLIRISGKQLQQIVDHAITDWTGNGHWLQVSGFVFRHDPDKQLASGLGLITPDGVRPIRPDDSLLAVTNNYLIGNDSDRDGYRMLDESLRMDDTLPQPDLKALVIERLGSAGDNGIAPDVQGRICNLQAQPDCRFRP